MSIDKTYHLILSGIDVAHVNSEVVYLNFN
jgi:hypothetical protein